MLKKLPKIAVVYGLLLGLSGLPAGAQTSSTKPKTRAATQTTAPAPRVVTTSSVGNLGNAYLSPTGEENELEVNLSSAEIHGYKYGNNSYTDINLHGAFNKYYKDSIQIGAEAGIFTYDTNSSKTEFELMGVMTYNFDRDLTNSPFVNFGLGFVPAADSTGSWSTKFGFFASVGKRFPIWSRVCYKPYFRLQKRGDMDVEWMIEAFNVSLVF